MTEAPTRRATLPRDEASYAAKRFRGAEYRTSRHRFGDLAIVVRRFPGTGTGQAYVLVHGLGVSSRYFRPLAVELANTGRVYLVELPGYGAAPDPRREVSIEDHAAVLLDFLRSAELDDPVLVGHSMGSQVVARAALLDPAHAQRVVLMAPTMPPHARGFWRGLGRLLFDGLLEPPVVTWIVVTDYIVRAGPKYVLRQAPHMFGDHLEEYLQRVASRVLVLIGDRDPIARE
ncbi:MAG: alpha/beta hydrolase, partial [Actinomycetota bacterium]|nr:alpha/beta hydrolase [Actinomycetota bacterium]